ncbi:hypothetical protein ACTJJE_07315 [Mycolicibacterium sp. 22603]|uniref:hypothetical protein n=1 Tax=Mycolicibacterium sp. 22603 TaxID=3453950 RepID=UPI003F85FB47
MSSDHLVVDLGYHEAAVGEDIDLGVGYGALLSAMTSPFATKIALGGHEIR